VHFSRMIGQSISHYRIVEKLGGGGMGAVYKAEDTELGRFVALKFLPEELAQDPQALERFRRKARAATALNHPNICTIHDIGEQDRHAFIATEFPGRDDPEASDRQSSDGNGLDFSLAIEIADALGAAYSAGIVQRDTNPAAGLTRRGYALVPKVMSSRTLIDALLETPPLEVD